MALTWNGASVHSLASGSFLCSLNLAHEMLHENQLWTLSSAVLSALLFSLTPSIIEVLVDPRSSINLKLLLVASRSVWIFLVSD